MRIEQAIAVVWRGTAFLRAQLFPGSRPGLAIDYAGDFDARLFAAREMPHDEVVALLGRDRLETEYFATACRILGLLHGILIDVARLLAGSLAVWFLLLLALARLKRRFAEIGEALRALEAFELPIEQTPYRTRIT